MVLSVWERVAVNVALAASAATILSVTGQRTGFARKATPDTRDEQTRYIFSGVLCAGIALWPVVWDACIGLNVVLHQPKLLLGFLFPMVMGAVELFVIMQRSARESKSQSLFAHHEMNADAGAIISAAFAMGSLFLRSSTQNYAATHILMYGLLLVIAFVVPTISVDPNSRTAILVRSVQKVLLSYALGFVVTGISMDLVKRIFDDAGAQLPVPPATATAAAQ